MRLTILLMLSALGINLGSQNILPPHLLNMHLRLRLAFSLCLVFTMFMLSDRGSAIFLRFRRMFTFRRSTSGAHRLINPILATGSDLQAFMKSGSATAAEIVALYFDQITQHDEYLKAMINTAPRAMEIAKSLDEERLRGHIRGPLHGIPLLIKVSPKLETI